MKDLSGDQMNSERQQLSFRLGQRRRLHGRTHAHMHTQIHKREKCLSIHSLRDEKEVRKAKTWSPRERLRVGWEDTAERDEQRVRGHRGGVEERWRWGGKGKIEFWRG